MRVSKNSPNYGRGVVTVEEDFVDEAEVRIRLEGIFRSPDYRPPTLPSVAMELLALSHDPDTDFQKVGKVLQSDALITGQVIKVAQSPVYAGRAQITSIQQALSRLGLTTLRDIVLQVSMNARVFRAKPYQRTMETLQRHSAAVAHISRIVSRYTALEGEYAFLCGLLHDVGIAGGLIALSENNRRPPPLDDIWSAVYGIHAEASQLMVEQWKLPPDVAWSVGAHHRVLVQGYPHPMAATLNLADALAKELGFTTQAGGGLAMARIEPMSREQVQATLGLTDKQVELLKQDAMDTLDKAAL